MDTQFHGQCRFPTGTTVSTAHRSPTSKGYGPHLLFHAPIRKDSPYGSAAGGTTPRIIIPEQNTPPQAHPDLSRSLSPYNPQGPTSLHPDSGVSDPRSFFFSLGGRTRSRHRPHRLLHWVLILRDNKRHGFIHSARITFQRQTTSARHGTIGHLHDDMQPASPSGGPQTLYQDHDSDRNFRRRR